RALCTRRPARGASSPASRRSLPFAAEFPRKRRAADDRDQPLRRPLPASTCPRRSPRIVAIRTPPRASGSLRPSQAAARRSVARFAALALPGDLPVLAVDAAQIAPGEEDRARSAKAAQTPLFAVIAAAN